MDEQKDITIMCADCQEEFVFTIGEQKFYEEKDFTPPKRCQRCRAVRKTQQAEDSQ